jgi:hypothetical protein
MELIHTCYPIAERERSVASYRALGERPSLQDGLGGARSI